MKDTKDTKIKQSYLKKGGGKLASDFHGQTDFSLKRKEEIISEQLQREKLGHEHAYNKKYNIK